MPKTTLLLCFILGLAVFFRIWGIDYGLPYFLVNDERALVYGALKMAELKTLIPALYPQEFDIMNYKYNFLMSYIYLIFLAPFILIQYLIGSFANFTELGNYFVLNPTSLWLVARVVTALMGAATVYLMYLIGKKIFNHWVGLIAALFLSINFLHIQLSHFTRPWVPMAFFTCLIMFLSACIYKSPKTKYYLWMGVVCGLAFGVSAATSVTMVIFFLSHFLLKKNFPEKLKDKNLWLALVVFALLAAVFLLVNPERFSAFSFGSSNLMEARGLADYLQGFALNLKALFFYEPILSIFSLLGLIIFWFKSKKLFFIFLSWPIFYISSLYFLSYVEFSMPVARYLLLIVPWLIILASCAIYHLLFKLNNLSKIIILTLIFIYPLAIAIQYDYLLSQKDTRILAKDWVEENIPAGSKIISNWNHINPFPTKEAILLQEQLDEGSLRIQDKVLLNLSDEDYPQPAYHILKTAYVDKERISEDPLQLIKNQQYQYFLEAEVLWGKDYWLPEEEQVLQKARLIQEFKQGQAKKAEDITCNFIRPVFIFFSLGRPGPTIKIYRLY